MNIYKKNLAPLTKEAWDEIAEQASKILKIYLTGREFVDIEGPTGLEQGGISTGRLLVPEKQNQKGIHYGLREFLPFVETRKSFELDIWELDNLSRGAKDIELESLEKAAKEIALFEDNAIYKGFAEGQIKGVENSASRTPVKIPDDPNEFLKSIGSEVIKMKKDGIEEPYSLVINEKKWQDLINLSKGYPILKQLEEIIKGKIVLNHSNNNSNSLLVSERGDDFELTLGQDISIGYESHTNKKVKLFFSETFTFRVLTPEAVSILKE